MADATVTTGKLTGPKVFLILCGFFGTIFAANGALVYNAATTWTGLEASKATVSGMKWNDELALARAQQARGWDVRAEVRLEAEAPHVKAWFMAADGLPAAVSSVEVMLKRPVDADFDRTIDAVALGGGAWQADIAEPLMAGQWDVVMTARNAAGEQLHRSVDRVFVK